MHFILLALALTGAERVVATVTSPTGQPSLSALEGTGFDVLEGGGEARQLIVTRDDVLSLQALGYTVDAPFPAPGEPPSNAGEMAPDGYPDLDEIEAALNRVATDHPDIAAVIDLNEHLGIADTHDGNTIKALRISDNPGANEDEPSVLFLMGLHPRELVPPVIGLHLAEELTRLYGEPQTDPVDDWVNNHQIWIIPAVNPDGYRHTFDVDPWWRKNRRPVEGGIGVDLNRNFASGWDGPCGGSADPTSIVYRGEEAGSEIESQVLMALAREQQFSKMLEFHSSGREVVWGYDCSTHPADDAMRTFAEDLAEAAGYGRSEVRPAADGEYFSWQLGEMGSVAFLMETHTHFQPSYASAQAEARRVMPAVALFMNETIGVGGRVADSCTNAPIAARLVLDGAGFERCEAPTSASGSGRFRLWLPDGVHTLTAHARGYIPAVDTFTVTDGAVADREIRLTALETCNINDDDCDGDIDEECGPAPVLNLPTCAPAYSLSERIVTAQARANNGTPTGGCNCQSGGGPGIGLLILIILWRQRRGARVPVH